MKLDRPWVMHMRWLDLAFLHYPVPAANLEKFIPKGLTLETFDGNAWLGVVPFRMDQIHARGLPSIPGTDAFLELNLRTYVMDGVHSGVWFFSLDAENPLAVRGARVGFHLPYMDAKMSSRVENGWFDYSSLRTHRNAPPATFKAKYKPVGEVFHAAPGTLEHWLTERYCLFSTDARGNVYRGDILHQPWSLQACEAQILENTMAEQIGITLPNIVSVTHFAKELDVRASLLVKVNQDFSRR
jgi:uncharacterized protein